MTIFTSAFYPESVYDTIFWNILQSTASPRSGNLWGGLW